MVRYLLDTSVWISWLRDDEDVTTRVSPLIEDATAEIVCCGPVRMELLQGAGADQYPRVRETVNLLPSLPIEDGDFDLAATIYHGVRADGHTVRSSLDCQIAAVAIRTEVTLVHRDVDFRRIAVAMPGLAVIDLTA